MGGSVGGRDEETDCTRLLLIRFIRSEGSDERRSKEPLPSEPLPAPELGSVRVVVPAAVVLVRALGGRGGVWRRGEQWWVDRG